MPAPGERPRSHILGLVARGFVIGSADLIPGVSGGTMALILGIYERLVTALGAVTQRPFRAALAGGRVREALRTIDAGFLAALAFGILAALVTLANLLEHLLATYPAYVFAGFFGLIAASVVLVGRRVDGWNPVRRMLFGAGAVGAFSLVGLAPTDTPDGPLFLAASGALAVCALILPGISGAYILVLLGKYQWALERVGNGDVLALLPVIAGAVVGLLGFARLLAWLLRTYPNATLAVLAGFLLGSLRKVWPWQDTYETITVNVLPPPDPAPVLIAVAIAAAGAVAVLALDRVAPEA